MYGHFVAPRCRIQGIGYRGGVRGGICRVVRKYDCALPTLHPKEQRMGGLIRVGAGVAVGGGIGKLAK